MLIDIRFPSLLSGKCLSVLRTTSVGNLTCHQNFKSIEYPPAASRHASPKLDAKGVRSIKKAIGDSHATPESDLRKP